MLGKALRFNLSEYKHKQYELIDMICVLKPVYQ